MKPKSISGFILQVADLDKTVSFYESLGFRLGKRTQTSVTTYVNWFWIDFVKSDTPGNSDGINIAVNVEVVDEFYAAAVDAGLTPETEPSVGLNGRREFTLRDPDGYKLTFFTKK